MTEKKNPSIPFKNAKERKIFADFQTVKREVELLLSLTESINWFSSKTLCAAKEDLSCKLGELSECSLKLSKFYGKDN